MRQRLFFAVLLAGVLPALAATQCSSSNSAHPAAQNPDVDASDTATAPDAFADVTAMGDATPVPEEPADTCPPSQTITVDTVNAPATVSASGIDTYTFTLSAPEGILVRVRPQASVTAPPHLSLTTACGAADAGGLPPSTTVANGAYTRGILAAGTYTLSVSWSGSVPGGAAYNYDVMQYASVSNASCASAASLAAATQGVTGMTFDATDTTTGCGGSAGYAQLFYSVEVPANTAREVVTGTPGAAWSMVLEAFSTCTSTACAEPTATSTQPGAPAILALSNTSPSPVTFVIGASIKTDQVVTGGGAFTLTAAVQGACGSAGDDPCQGTDICCGGFCEAPGTANSCGQAGASCVACPADPGGHGIPACNGPTCSLQCATGYCLDAAGTQCVAWDSTHCGTDSCVDCTMTAPTGATASCNSVGACTSACPAGTCLSGNACVTLDVNHCGPSCGSCGANPANGTGWTCSAAATCQATCSAGFADCDGNPANGCEVTTSSDPRHCSTCGNDCTAQAPAGTTETCNGGTCSAPTCQTNYCENAGFPSAGCSLGNTSAICANGPGGTPCSQCSWNATASAFYACQLNGGAYTCVK